MQGRAGEGAKRAIEGGWGPARELGGPVRELGGNSGTNGRDSEAAERAAKGS